MNFNQKNILFVCLIASVLTAACAKPPVEEMEKASASVAQAESDPDVNAYAVGALSRAREALANMRAESEAKRYDEARRLASEAISLAERAISEGRSGAVRARDDAAAAIAVMETAITETDSAIESARKSKQKDVDFKSIDKDFADAKTGANGARDANEGKRYREAVENSSAVRSQLSGITGRIGTAAIAASRKK